ncbi:MAG: DUF58 domain-containing protein [Proteobacteria bacterium]|nr:MAG: DUF58 domain-containing protein [Pseudomonadota bacterium]PIE18224.1 MAG: DUF58 domain-containing protein [Pseudomonadota bacterium]
MVERHAKREAEQGSRAKGPPVPARRRRLRFTREGKYFVGLTFAIGFAAINTGNNLLYLVLGMLLTLIVGSGVLSEIALRSLVAARQPPQRLFAHTPFLMGIRLHNAKRRLPSFSIEVEDVLTEAPRAPSAEERPLDKKCFFLKIPAGRTQRTSYRHAFTARGRYRLTSFAVSTRFPFGLFEKARRLGGEQELLVFPQVLPLPALPATYRDAGEQRSPRLGRAGEYHALRDYRQGDDPRDIAWRNSAKLGRPLVREHEDPRGQRVTIFLDNLGASSPSPAQHDRQEQAVSEAASHAAHLIARGLRVALVSRSFDLPAGSGPAHLDRMLTALALISFVGPDVPTPALPRDVLHIAAPFASASEAPDDLDRVA